MKWLCRNIYRKEKGFTLIELMIVIIILAILTGIAIPSYLALRNRARVAAAQSEMRNIATALEMYQIDHNVYPATGITAMISALEGGDYMNPVPTLDPWGYLNYVYTLTGTGKRAPYTLECYGPDGVDGGTDDIVIINGRLQ